MKRELEPVRLRARDTGLCKRALITGGMGFIGSNLALRLVELGVDVTVVDSRVVDCGSNPWNLSGAAREIRVIERDISEAAGLQREISESDVIFNLASEISHIHSMQYPQRDCALNAVAQLRFVQACERFNPGVRIVYASTRQIYGIPHYLPVDEGHPVHPVDYNGVHKYAAMMYHLIAARRGRLDAVVLCLSNVYGPRMAINIPCQGVLGNFVRRLMQGTRLEVFGNGRQLRDPVYVDDVVDAFLRAAGVRRPRSRTYNLGGPDALALRKIAQIASSAAGVAAPVVHPFPKERKSFDIGSYYTDSSLILRELGWKPRVKFEEGIARTLEYYRKELSHYLEPDGEHTGCKLTEQKSARGMVAAAL
ncbi:MAG TPA: NAD-dependent epimerase/dehydratase family protein [Bryobacteraceae bacterium]|nr:NAD-dependent epimerase/dehydratase family protein [Bryobacteraceae bacterium]